MKHLPSLTQSTILTGLILAVLTIGPVAAQAQTQDLWLVTSGMGDFNVASNWNLNAVPISGYAANNDVGSNNVVQITANDPTFTFNGFRDGISASGAFLQSGSTVNLGVTQGGWLRMGLNTGSVGYYTIMSNAILNTPDGVTVGESGTGYLNIYGGTINAGNAKNFIVSSNGQGGTMTQTNGTVICTGQVWIGQGTASQNAIYNMSGGTFSCTNWFVLGRSGGTGTMTMTGGTLNAGGNGGFLDVGTGFQGNGVGVLNQSGGTINIVGNGMLAVPETAGGTGTYNLSGTGALYCNNWITIGRGGVGTLNMSGGMIVKTDSGNDHIDIGAGGSTGSAGTGTINQTGGMITNTTTDFWLGEVANAAWNFSGGTNYLGNLIICEGSGINATLTLNGGFLSVGTIHSAQPVASYSTLALNGGTIQASGNSSSFIYNLNAASLQAGGVTIDTQGYTETIPQALADGGGGGIVKIGSGGLTLSGANTYIGATAVNAGTLATTTASIGAGSYSVSSGATLSVQVATANTELSASSVTFAGPNTLNIDLNTFGVPSSAPINVIGALTANGTVTVNLLSSVPVAVGPIPLVQYGSPAGAGTFVLGSIPPGESGYLTNSGSLISLVITGAGAPRWNGNVTGGVWDINTTTNWIDLITASPTTYHDGEPVLFDDTATGTTTVSLATTVQPGSVTFNNTLTNYTLTGAGKISGTTGVVLEGSNTVSMLNTGGNSYAGPTVLDAGTLVVTSLANGGSPSAIGASSSSPTNLIMAGGTLSYTGPVVSINRGYAEQNTNGTVDIDAENNLTLSGSVTAALGSGFTKAGPAQLTYATVGSNTLSDALGFTVEQGTVLFNGTGSGQTNNIAGNFDIGTAGSSNAAIVLSNNTTVNLKEGTTEVGNGGGLASSGAITVTGGTLNAGTGQIWIGQGSNGVGALTISGGTFIADNWLAIGRAGGTGTLTLSSGVLLDQGGGGNLDIGTSGGINGVAGTGTLNQTGGAITNTASQTWLGEGTSGEPAAGTWNMSGGTAQLGELHVGVGGTGISTLNISATAAMTCAGYVDISLAANANGNVNLGSISQPGGSLTANGDLTVGDIGNGVINMVTNGGGLLTVHGTLYLSRNSATAFGTINLNSGTTIVTSYLNNGWGFGHGLTNNPQAFNFNGGTLRAYTGSSFFIQPYVNAVVQAGAAIIDDGGFSIEVLAALVDGGGGGGLTKLGNGTLWLNGVNTYTGTTLVSAGTLEVGASGSIAGPVTIASGATLAADTGSIQTTYINNTLTLAAGSTTTMKITPSSNDQIAGLTGVNYSGALVVTNISGSPLILNSVFQLFHSAAPGSGNFSSITILPYGTGTFNPTNGLLTITSVTQSAPVVNPPSLSGGNLILTGTGGTAGGGYTVLSSTNVAAPLANWVTNTTGTFNGSGGFSNAIPVTNVPAMFFQVRVP